MSRLHTGMRIGRGGPRTASLMARAGLLAAVAALSACGGTTYGTGTTAEKQLVEDLTGALSLTPDRQKPINYAPRAGLVKPPSTEVLPPPQEDAARNNPAWPESPEERLARVRAEATANQDNPYYRPNVIRDIHHSENQPEGLSADRQKREEQRKEFQRRKQMARQGSPNTRRYLSDPPVEYRQPAETAPAGELGEDEWKKKRQAASEESGGGLRRLIPWLN